MDHSQHKLPRRIYENDGTIFFWNNLLFYVNVETSDSVRSWTKKKNKTYQLLVLGNKIRLFTKLLYKFHSSTVKLKIEISLRYRSPIRLFSSEWNLVNQKATLRCSPWRILQGRNLHDRRNSGAILPRCTCSCTLTLWSFGRIAFHL